MSQQGQPIVSQADAPDPAPPLLTADQGVETPSSQSQQWGLYIASDAVIVADNVVRVSYKANSDVPTYPQEQGAFQSYNKVQLPFKATLRFSTGGSVADRTSFLNSVDTAKLSFNLYDLVIPEEVYPNVTVTDYEYDRDNGNSGLLVVDIMVEEIRQTGQQNFTTQNGQTPITNAQAPGANNPQNDGTVQPTSLSAQQQMQIQSSLPKDNGPGLPPNVFE